MAAAVIGGGSPADAQQATGKPPGWAFQLTPYVWFASLKGHVATLPGLPPASVDVSFSDILENTDEAVMLAAEARHGRVGIVAELTYLGLSANGNTPGALFGKAEANVDTLFATAAGFYRPIATEAATVDVLAGARIWYVDTELKLTSGLLPGRQTQEDETWADPLVGVRASLDLGRGFFISGLADIGGFGVASDYTWEVLGTVDYRFRDWGSARVGYRHLEVDYKNGGFVFDVEMSGPIAGLSFRF
jgi:hypothetical protein